MWEKCDAAKYSRGINNDQWVDKSKKKMSTFMPTADVHAR